MARASGNKPEVKAKKRRKSIVKYFREVVSELKKVTWPNRKELINSTVAAIVFIIIFAIVVGLIDLILGQLLKLIT
ncbi:MAG: preprotein translocase subunit SecE [Clostridiales bacterium]|jgi:preprotein translocase subunit SecE|nr:preprotein translocase subunit SecE [Clostridiales bacterium]